MKYLFITVLCLLLVSCHKDASIAADITTGLVVNIPLDGTGYDSISKTTGLILSTSGLMEETSDRHGIPSHALSFMRTDSSGVDMGDLAGASFPDGKFTISVWVKAADTSKVISILSKRSPYGPFEYSIDNHFGHGSFKMDNWTSSGGSTVYGVDPLNAAAAIKPNTWKHIAFVGDGSILKVYVDGLVSSQTDQAQAGKSFTNTAAHFVIGNGGGYGANNYFDGAIDDIRLYNRALDATSVLALANL